MASQLREPLNVRSMVIKNAGRDIPGPGVQIRWRHLRGYMWAGQTAPYLGLGAVKSFSDCRLCGTFHEMQWHIVRRPWQQFAAGYGDPINDETLKAFDTAYSIFRAFGMPAIIR